LWNCLFIDISPLCVYNLLHWSVTSSVSNLDRWSCYLFFFCLVELKRDQCNCDWTLKLHNTPNPIDCICTDLFFLFKTGGLQRCISMIHIYVYIYIYVYAFKFLVKASFFGYRIFWTHFPYLCWGEIWLDRSLSIFFYNTSTCVLSHWLIRMYMYVCICIYMRQSWLKRSLLLVSNRMSAFVLSHSATYIYVHIYIYVYIYPKPSTIYIYINNIYM